VFYSPVNPGRFNGLASEDFGREFSTGSETFRITGIEPRRPKYPIKAERLTDRRGFKFSPENVAMYLKAEKGAG